MPLSLAADKSFQLSHTYLDNGSYAVTVSVDDGHTSGSDSFQVTVSNVAPSVLAGLDATIAAGGTLSRPGSFSDPGSLDSWTATVDYGDGSGVQPLLLGLDHSFQLLHTYASAGQFTLTVTVTDDDGGAGSDTVTVTVEAAPTFTLMVAAAGSGSGQVTGPGIACPGDCTQSYTVDTEVVLHAARRPGLRVHRLGRRLRRRRRVQRDDEQRPLGHGHVRHASKRGTDSSTQAATALSRRARCSRGRVRSPIRMRIAGLRRSTTATGRVRCRCRWRRTRASSCRTRISTTAPTRSR